MSELLLNLLKERIRQGGDVSVELSGHSMYPTIRDGEKSPLNITTLKKYKSMIL